jgi:hypothetical protein
MLQNQLDKYRMYTKFYKWRIYCKKVSDFPVPSPDVTNQTLPCPE